MLKIRPNTAEDHPAVRQLWNAAALSRPQGRDAQPEPLRRLAALPLRLQI